VNRKVPAGFGPAAEGSTRGKLWASASADWHFIKVKGRSVYLYRAIDRDGNLVDVLLSEKRDKAAAEAFFRSARTVTGRVPERVTSDGHDAYPGAIKAAFGEEVRHRTNRYLNNHLEQDHRGIKQRIRPMGGFKSVASATRFCQAHDEVRNFLRPRSRRNEIISLAQRRVLYTAHTDPPDLLGGGINRTPSEVTATLLPVGAISDKTLGKSSCFQRPNCS
jgi:putative transposase